MKIAYLCADRGVPVLGHKGASVHVREFVSALARQEHDVVLLCAKLGSGNDCPPVRVVELPPEKNRATLIAEGAMLGLAGVEEDPILSREVEKLANDRQLSARVLESLHQLGFRPDAIYERYALFHRAGNEIANALRIPRILEMNAPLVEEQERFRGLRLKRIAEEVSSESLRGASHIVAVSSAVKEAAVASGVAAERISVMPNGVDTTRFHSGAGEGLIRARYELKSNPVIGFIGSLKPWHGLDFLLDAFEEIHSARPDAVLMIVGDGPGMAALQARVAQENLQERVILAGHVPYAEIPAYLSAMDLTVAPYDAQDGFYFSPLKVVESLAAGCPVVAPELGQISDLIQNGLTGLLYPPGDSAALAGQVIGLLNDAQRRGEMGCAAAAMAREKFSWDKNAQYTTELMSQLSLQEVR